MSKTSAVLFDLDGVLADLCEVHRVALNEAIAEVTDNPDSIISIKEHESEFNGLPTLVKLGTLRELNRLEDRHIVPIYDNKQAKTIEVINTSISSDPKLKTILGLLQAYGIRVAVVSNSIRDTIEMSLKKLQIYDLVDVIISNEDILEPKPSPEGYLKAVEVLKADLKSSVIVEDSRVGVMAARASGIRVVEIRTPSDLTLDLIKKEITLNED